MLSTFRKGAHGFLAKLLLAALIASFALWGIGDVFRGSNDTAVATVNGEAITQLMVDNTLQNMRQQFQDVPAELFNSRAMQLQALNQLIDIQVVQAEADDLGIRFSEQTVIEAIRNDPNFQNVDGSFNKLRLTATINSYGGNEALFMEYYRRNLQRRFLSDVVVKSLHVPRHMVELYYHIEHEKRRADMIIIGPEDVGSVDAPTEEDIQKYYKSHKSRYQKPEFRRFSYIALTPELIESRLDITVSQQEIEQYYQANADLFAKPARLEVNRVFFEQEEQALDAYQRLVGDEAAQAVTQETWQSVLAALGYEQAADFSTDIVLAEQPVEVADALTPLKQHQINVPVETDFGWALYRMVEKHEAGLQPLDAVAEDIEAQLQAQKRSTALDEISNTLDDAVAGGASLEEALKQAGLEQVEPETFGPISSDFIKAQGGVALPSVIEQEVVNTGFGLQEGTISPMRSAEDGTYFMVLTEEVTPSTTPPLEEIRARVIKDVEARQLQNAVSEHAQKIATQMRDAENTKILAQDSGITLHDSGELTRSSRAFGEDSSRAGESLSASLVNAIFQLRRNHVSAPYPLGNQRYAIAIVKEIIEPEPPGELDFMKMQTQLQSSLQDELFSAYLQRLRTKHDVERFPNRLQGRASTMQDLMQLGTLGSQQQE